MTRALRDDGTRSAPPSFIVRARPAQVDGVARAVEAAIGVQEAAQLLRAAATSRR